MKIAEIKKLTTKELIEASSQLRADIAATRRRIHMGETSNVRMLRAQRKELARMLTVLSEQLTKENA